MSQSRSTAQSVYVYLLEVRLLYPLFVLYKKYHKKLFLLIFFCFLFVANLKLDSVEFQQKLDFVFPPRVQLQNSRRQSASLLIFFVIYKLFKIYITISLQYYTVQYGFHALPPPNQSCHFLTSNSQSHKSWRLSSFCLCWVMNCMEMIFCLLQNICKEIICNREIRCSVLSWCAANWLFYMNNLLVFLFVILASNYSTENVQHLAKQIFNSNTTLHK